MVLNRFSLMLVSVVSAALTGCFNEPTPAYKTVPAEARVYLQNRGLEAFSSIPSAALVGGEKIDYLNLDRNALKSVDGVEKLTGLKWLRLNENDLSSLPELSALVNLRRVYLRDNHFQVVPETLKNLPALTDLELSGNPISEIPAWLAGKKGLKNLSFNRTRLQMLPEDLSAWKTLHSLQLGELRLSAEEMARIRAALPDVAIVF